MTKAVACNQCGSTHWARVAGGNATWDEWIETDAESPIVEQEDVELSLMSSTEWTCANGHKADDEQADAVEELRH